VSARYRQVVRQEARYSEAVNGYFICDRGRYGFYYASHEERPRQALVEGEEVPFGEAARVAGEKLAQIGKSAGPEAVACVGSGRSSLETQAMLKRVCQMKGWKGPSYFAGESLVQKVKTASSRLEPELTVSLRELEGADFIVVVGADPINEAPMLALAMRQSQRSGCKIAVIDPRPISLPFDFQHLPAALDEVNRCLGALIETAVDREAVVELEPSALEFYQAISALDSVAPPLLEQISAVAQDLRQSQRPIIVCGTEIVRQSTPALAADCCLLLHGVNKKAGLFFLMPGANAFGAAHFSGEEGSFAKTLEGIEDGKIRGLILAESDLFWRFEDRQRLDAALEKVDFLVVLDFVNSPGMQKAHVFLPTSTIYEAGGILINQEGRLQAAPRAYRGGIPLALIGGGAHPPRVYGSDIPGGELPAAWQVLAEIADGESHPDTETTRAKLRSWLADVNPVLANIPAIDEFPDDGIRLSLGENTPDFSMNSPMEVKTNRIDGQGLELILVDWTFGTEELSVYSPPLAEVEKNPCLFMHVDDAARLGLNSDDRVAVKLDGGAVKVSLHAVENMASGVMVLPRHRLLRWQKIRTLPKIVRFEDIEKIEV